MYCGIERPTLPSYTPCGHVTVQRSRAWNQATVKDSIVHHLKQTIHHAKTLEVNEMGYGDQGRWWGAREMTLAKPCPDKHEATTRIMELESIEARVLRIRSEVENTNEKSVSQTQQRSWAAQLEEIAVMIGKLAAAEQPGFVPEPR